MRVFVNVWPGLLAGIVHLCSAKAAPVYVQEHTRSPNGRMEIVIVESGDDTGIALGEIEIRNRGTEEILGAFNYSSFGVHPNSQSLSAMWRPDNRWVAVWWAATRGYTSCSLYAPYHGKWTLVPLPNYMGPIRKLAGIKSFYPKGSEIPQSWLPHSRLVIEVYNRMMDRKYFVTLKVQDSVGDKRATARVQSIRVGADPAN